MSDKKQVSHKTAVYGQMSRDLASSTEGLTSAVVTELTEDEILLVMGAAEPD